MKKGASTQFDLLAFRKQLDLTQMEIAELFGVSRTTYGDWEKNKAPSWIELACRGLRASMIFPAIGQQMTAADLIQARSQLGLYQEDFAQELGVSRSTISRMENGQPHRWVGYVIAALAVTGDGWRHPR